ncbi:hypothetical protein E2C01_061944 [Portunus trituberculatus]|uniref:Uncharacterized protein n=1 Tax=Portunus trituberculatus TaxID=210409 RepID=A0A5B7H572_PORTR|nr:hypothetical protein [Portunus trituberculatus]
MKDKRILRQRSWLKYRCSLDLTWAVTRVAAAEVEVLLFMTDTPPDPRRCRSQRTYTPPGQARVTVKQEASQSASQPVSQPASTTTNPPPKQRLLPLSTSSLHLFMPPPHFTCRSSHSSDHPPTGSRQRHSGTRSRPIYSTFLHLFSFSLYSTSSHLYPVFLNSLVRERRRERRGVGGLK